MKLCLVLGFYVPRGSVAISPRWRYCLGCGFAFDMRVSLDQVLHRHH